MAETSFRPTLDHIVILVSQSALAKIDQTLSRDFVVAPGGVHADGLTHNKLILFQDGVYIELIAFYDNADPAKRAAHRWGKLPENSIVDWAYTLDSEGGFAAVQQRIRDAQDEYTYTDPTPGGRTKPDGTVLKWAISAGRRGGEADGAQGYLPFWCLDRTPRHLRVPYQGSELTRHPSKVRGVAKVAIRAAQDETHGLARVFDALHAQSSDKTSPSWSYAVLSDVGSAEHKLELLEGLEAGQARIGLTFVGDVAAKVELLPGLEYEVVPNS
jgi:hypothetical protein